MGKVKTYFKDYFALCKESGKFMKKHWFGTLVLSTGIFVAELAPAYIRYKKSEREMAEYQKAIKLEYERKKGSKKEEEA